MAFYKCPKQSDIKLVPWSTGTVAEIKAMVDGYYAGKLTLQQIQSVWGIGDERIVSLSAMEASGVSESHVAQNVTMVIMNFGGKKLSSDPTTDVLAVIGQKNILSNNGTVEGGYINASRTSNGGWDSCNRRTWCNNVYRNAIPSDFRAIFKQFDNVTANGSGSTAVTSSDYFALASEKEVFGTVSEANATAEASNIRFDYYRTTNNRKKSYNWWERSASATKTDSFCMVNSAYGTAARNTATTLAGIAPFGCI